MNRDRRSMLQLLAASPIVLSALGNSARAATPAPSGKKVIVIGAGIVGAGIGYELAKRGAQVTILDRASPGQGVTRASFAYLNASAQAKADSAPYFKLNWLGIAGWRVWQNELGGRLPLQLGGAVVWKDKPDEIAQLLARLGKAQKFGYAAHAIDAGQLSGLLPSVNTSNGKSGVFFPEEGSVDPAEAVAVLLEQAQQLGAKVQHPVEVTKLLVSQGRVTGVATRDGELTADTVVIAAGPGSEALARSLGVNIPLTSTTLLRLQTRPLSRRVLERVVFAPGSGSFRQKLDGRFLVSTGGVGGLPAGVAPEAFAQTVKRKAEAYLPELSGVEIDDIAVAPRFVPADTFPIVGFAPQLSQLYVAVTHSGVTLAPIVGRLATSEILDGTSPELLTSFRPARFA